MYGMTQQDPPYQKVLLAGAEPRISGGKPVGLWYGRDLLRGSQVPHTDLRVRCTTHPCQPEIRGVS